MGEVIEAAGISTYVAGGGGPCVVVLHEWWGLVPRIKDVCDRFAAAGFTAFVLIHVAEHEEHNWPALPAHFPRWFEGMPNVDNHIYEGTQHAFFNDVRADLYDEAAAKLSWDRTLSFLRQHLGHR